MLAVSLFLMLYGSIGYVSRYHFKGSFGFVICVIGVLLACLCTKPKINISSFITLGALSALGAVLGFIHGDGVKRIVIDVLSLVIAFAWICFVDFEAFKRAFLDVFLFTSVYGIAAWITYSVFPQAISIFPKMPCGVLDAYDLFFCVIRDIRSGPLRLYSFAWEPGAYQTFLNIAILIAGMQKKHRLINLAILYTALVLTFSTTGYIVGIMNIAILIFAVNIDNKQKIKKYILIASAAGLVFLAVATATGITQYVFNKVLGMFDGLSSNGVSTSSARVDSLFYPLVAFINNPLLGVGQSGLDEIRSTLPHSVLSCTPTNYLAIYGIFYSAIIGACWYKFIKLIVGKNRFIIIAGLISFIVSIISEHYVTYITMNMFILYGSTLLFNNTKLKKGLTNESSVN